MFNNPQYSTANVPYIGRFAPSPTGPLHFGSLLAALASYLDAKSHNGKWLIRIEDLDPPREMAHAKQRILEALDAYQLYSDDPVVFQSERSALYQTALDQLISQQRVFACTCSRKQLNAVNGIHFGNCHSNLTDCHSNLTNSATPFAWRFDCQFAQDAEHAYFNDALQGHFQQSLQHDIGDFVVKRKDLLWAYQLAMVVDDFEQGVTHVVRGIDLIDSTLRQNMLQQALNYPQPKYAHIPVACASNGQKLSKQNLAPALDIQHPAQNIWRALSWLGQKPPKKLQLSSVKELLLWGIEHWQPLNLYGIHSKSAE